MKLNKEISTQIALLVVTIIAVLIGGVFYWQSNQVKEIKNNRINLQVEQEKKDLITYSSEEYGFRVRYSSNSFLQEKYDRGKFSAILYRKDLPSPQIAATIDVFEDKSYQERINELKSSFQEIVNEENITELGSRGKKLKLKGIRGVTNATLTHRVIERKPFVYSLGVVPDKLFSNFEFIDIKPVSTSGWQEYSNDDFGFRVKYPLDFEVEEKEGSVSFIPPRFQNRQNLKVSFMKIYPKKVPVDKSLRDVLASDLNLSTPEAFKGEELHIRGVLTKKTNIGGADGYKIATSIDDHRVECKYYVKQGDIFIKIEKKLDGLEDSACFEDPTFNKMLSTFEFLD